MLGWRVDRSAALAAIAAIAVAVSACGDDSSAGDVPAGAGTSTSRHVDASRPGPSGALLEDRGPPRQRAAVLAMLRRLQAAFQAGDMRRACRTLTAEAITQFGSLGKCMTSFTVLAREMRAGRVRLPRPTVTAVRVYPPYYGGVTLREPNGGHFRVPLARDDEGWRVDLQFYGHKSALNGR